MAEKKYSKTHEWVEFSDEKTAKIGLSEYAAHHMGALVFINLPEEGDEVTAGENLGDAESIKAVSDILSPVSGEVSAVNEAVLDEPGCINENPSETWLVEVGSIEECEELMDEAEYKAYCESL